MVYKLPTDYLKFLSNTNPLKLKVVSSSEMLVVYPLKN